MAMPALVNFVNPVLTASDNKSKPFFNVTGLPTHFLPSEFDLPDLPNHFSHSPSQFPDSPTRLGDSLTELPDSSSQLPDFPTDFPDSRTDLGHSPTHFPDSPNDLGHSLTHFRDSSSDFPDSPNDLRDSPTDLRRAENACPDNLNLLKTRHLRRKCKKTPPKRPKTPLPATSESPPKAASTKPACPCPAKADYSSAQKTGAWRTACETTKSSTICSVESP